MDNRSRPARNRLTCTECSRRKIRCDKNVPCGPCIRRSVGQYCTRSITRQADASVSSVIETLMQRVSELERRPATSERDPASSVLPESDNVQSPNGAAIARSASEASDTGSTASDPPLIEHDSATVLEFLAWGRRKDHELHKDGERENGPRKHSTSGIVDESRSMHQFETIIKPQTGFLATLLPDETLVRTLTRYHGDSLLWYHGSYNAWSFAKDVDMFYSDYHGMLAHSQVNLQWVALLFAILTGSLTCASSATLSQWGFDIAERNMLSRQWYHATITCLNLADYLEVHTTYAVSAICSLTISAHILGFSNSQSVLLSSATRIAQSLGLHRLGGEETAAKHHPSRTRQRETGRRIWCQLCTQDWFSVPFADSYSINVNFFTTTKPMNCNEDDQLRQPDSIPTITSYCNYLYDIARLIPQLQDVSAKAKTPYTRYEYVLEFDERMRKLATAFMPTFLKTSTEVSEVWPSYVPWGRRSLAICAAHKIIMIHRKFLGLSFTNSAFSFTRRTCLAACKTILKEATTAVDDEAPVLWIDQAFSVAAAIILLLDAFYRSPGTPEYEDDRRLARQAIEYLRSFEATGNKIAARGVRLLSFLLDELETSGFANSAKRKRGSEVSAVAESARRPTKAFDLGDFLQRLSNQDGAANELPNATAAYDSSVESLAWDAFEELMPPQTGFGGAHLFDDFFSFTA